MERINDILQNHDKDKPLFLMFTSQNAHGPLEAPQSYIDKYSFIQDLDRRTYLAMVSLVDEAIGNITSKMEELGLLKDTLILFTSDNGGPLYAGSRNYPLRGGKMTPYEGGHRVRAFINGPGIVPHVNKGMFHSIDWLPTALNAALGSPIGLLIT